MTQNATVGDFMTPNPHTIGQEQPLSVAHGLMREHHIHHLPVLHAGALVGLVTLLDLEFVEQLDLTARETLTVEEAMTSELYLVATDTPLADVVKEMVGRDISSAVVVDPNKHVLGVFSTVDALRALDALFG